jgi:hypothetical protein
MTSPTSLGGCDADLRHRGACMLVRKFSARPATVSSQRVKLFLTPWRTRDPALSISLPADFGDVVMIVGNVCID